MSITTRYIVGLGLIAAAGATALGVIATSTLDKRDREYFAGRVWCESSFDALSAACGAGLMMGDLSGYSAEARWVLFGTGVAGALLHVLTLAAVIRRIIGLPAPTRSVEPVEPATDRPDGTSADAQPDPSSTALDPPVTPSFTDGPSLGFIALSFLSMLSLLTVLVFAAARATCPTVTFA
ncbi:MAG: hypothetical protein IT450_12690, partial [Phycisphaerales bacterium]|nr:hypothetical protein [Phycisphaerales bacterium]